VLTAHPILTPVAEKSFPADPTEIVLSHIPGSVAILGI